MKQNLQRFSGFFFIFVAIVFGFASFSSSLSAAATIGRPTNYLGLVGHWTFDGKDMVSNVADISGQANHGSLRGQTSTTTAMGKIGQAITFDGSNDYVLVGDKSSLVSSQGTVCSWVKPTTDGPDTIFTSFDNSVSTGWSLFVGNGITGFLTDELISLSVTVNGSSVTRLGYTSATRTEIYDGDWHHVCLTANGSSYAIYLDGVSKTVTVGSGSNNGAFTDIGGTKLAYLGAQDFASFGYFGGSMDDTRVYNRALSANEVNGLYNSGSPKLATAKPVVSNSLVGHWTFDGKDMVSNVADASGNGKHGALQGQAATTTTLGKVGQALLLDGTDDFVDFGDTNDYFDFGATADFSVSFWIKTDLTSSQHMVSKYSSGISPGFSIQIFTGKAFAFIRDGAGGGGTEIAEAPGNTTISGTGWHHVVAVYDRGDSLSLYVDGALDTTPVSLATLTGSISNSSSLIVGKKSGGTPGFVNGAMDDVRIYNKALSLNEIAGIYNSGAAKFGVSKAPALSSGLVGHWTFDGKDMTPNVRDISGQGNHGSLSGQTSTTTAMGKIGQALRLDGINDRVNVGMAPSLITDDGTFCSWVKLPADADSSRTIYDATNDVAPSSYVTSIVLGNGAAGVLTNEMITFYIWSQGNVNVLGYTTATRSELYDDQWHHICVTADTGYKIYLDGVSKTITVGAGSNDGIFMSSANLNSISIGGYPPDDVWTKGLIDDVRAYNRALSANEVLQLYNLGK